MYDSDFKRFLARRVVFDTLNYGVLSVFSDITVFACFLENLKAISRNTDDNSNVNLDHIKMRSSSVSKIVIPLRIRFQCAQQELSKHLT